MRILLADGRPKVRFALRVLLERQPGLEIVGEASDANQLLAQAETACPDLVLIGWELPGLRALDSLVPLRALCPGLSVIALSGRPEVRRAALRAGADSFVSKADPPERLLAAIERCCHNGSAISARRAQLDETSPDETSPDVSSPDAMSAY